MKELENQSESELQELLNNTARILNEKREAKRKEAIAQIQQIADAAGITVVIKEERKKKSEPFVVTEATYQHPEKPELIWNGRGATPRWLKELMKSGRNKAEFEVATQAD